jgi:hypothetical protein
MPYNERRGDRQQILHITAEFSHLGDILIPRLN